MEYRLRAGQVVGETFYPKVPHMKSEVARRKTFASWPSASPMTPNELAQAGFYYMGQKDLVRCFCCAGMLGGWEPGDGPWEEHERHFPNCYFVLGHNVGNISLSFEERLQGFQRILHPTDHERLAQNYSTGTTPADLFENAPYMTRITMSDLETDNCTDFSALPVRVDSFRGSRLAEQVPAERLARAGFYFTGPADRVQCFSCKKTVENWCREDTPVERHKAVSPTCTFLSCTNRGNPIFNSSYNEAAEDMEYRLRTGEVVDESFYPKVPHMKSEEARLETFASWPSASPMRPNELAQAGLYYMGQNDLVRCFCCAGMLGGWEPGDGAWEEHEKHFPNCYFVLGHDVGNIPLPGGSQEEEGGSSGHRANSQVVMGSFEERLQSFQGVLHPIDHERLAQAGFYSSGTGDRVLCFYCGGGLKAWQPEEDPWEEHAKHYPGCNFLLREKGQEFVNNIQLKSNATSSHQNGFSQDGSDVLQSSVAQKAIEMGLEPSLVESTILERIRNYGSPYSSVQALVGDCLNPPDNEASVAKRREEDPMKKLEKLQREKQCKICMDRDFCMVFIPCGHLVCCEQCSAAIDKCPICCTTISQKIKTYIS